MKKLLKMVTISLAVTIGLGVSALAANFDTCADSLKDLGLFQGGVEGYQLDHTPTRAEAAAMVVRLMGKETEAKTLTYTAPFQDLDQWEKPYVQYLYQNHLINGTTSTQFNPNSSCDATMYSVLLMRAFGYQEDKDFTYATALQKAEDLGLVDAVDCNTTRFLRDHLVAMSYTALFQTPKGETTTLLDDLTTAGVVNQQKATSLKKFFKTYQSYLDVSKAYQKSSSMSSNVSMAAKAKMNDQDLMSLSCQMAVAAKMDLENLNQSQMAMSGTYNMNLSQSLTGAQAMATNGKIQLYYTDGYCYMSMGDVKYKMPMDFSEMKGILQQENSGIEPISMIKDITSSVSNGTTVYTVQYQPGALKSMVDSVLSTMNLGDDSAANIQFGDTTCKVTVKGNKVTAMNLDMNMSITAAGEKVDLTIQANYDDIKTGSSVKVTMPNDLNTYTAEPDTTISNTTESAK